MSKNSEKAKDILFSIGEIRFKWDNEECELLPLEKEEILLTLIDEKLSGVEALLKDTREESGIVASLADTCALKITDNPEIVADLRGIETKANGLRRRAAQLHESLKVD